MFETTGIREHVDDAMYLTGEGKKLVLMGMKALAGLDPAPFWFKAVQVFGTSFSGQESDTKETFDIALEMALEGQLPVADLITHRFRLDDHQQALAAVADRSVSKAVKAIFQHVV